MKKARPAPLDVLNRVRINNTLETPRSTIKTILNVPLQTELKFNRKNLKKVEDQLKLAFIEFHQKLRILKNYCLEESHGKYHSVGEIQKPPASVVAVATIRRPPNPHLHVRRQRPDRLRHDDSLRWPRDRVLTVLQFPHPHLQRNQHRPGFRHRQKSQLPVFRRRHHLGPLDSTPNRFDNNYYQNLVARRGLLHSDQVLFNGGSQDATVRTYSINPAAFLRDFGAAMVKMGNISPLTGTNGEIRRSCRVIYS